MVAAQPVLQQKAFIWLKRIFMILFTLILILVTCSVTFWFSLTHRYRGMQPIASHTYSWLDFSGMDTLLLGELQAEDLISLNISIEQGEVNLHAENDAGEKIQIYENPFEKGACLMVVPSDGTYCLQFSAEDSYFTIAATVLHETN